MKSNTRWTQVSLLFFQILSAEIDALLHSFKATAKADIPVFTSHLILNVAGSTN